MRLYRELGMDECRDLDGVWRLRLGDVGSKKS